MKQWAAVFVLVVMLMSCRDGETLSDFTGNEVVYSLPQASAYPVSGSITFRELKDGTTYALVELGGTDGTAKLPVHLHLGDISLDGAAVAVLLNPVDAATGKSETRFSKLSDETPITYKDLLSIEANIKVHLSDTGPEKNIILAGSNIGSLYGVTLKNGRSGFGVCKSE